MSPFHLYPYLAEAGVIKYKILFEDERFDTLAALCNMENEAVKNELISRLQSEYARSDGVKIPSFQIDWMPFGRVRITDVREDGFTNTKKCVIDIERKELLYLFRSYAQACKDCEYHDKRLVRKGSVIESGEKAIVIGKAFSDMSELLVRHALLQGYDVIGLFKEFDICSRKGIRQVAEYYCAEGGLNERLFVDDIEKLMRAMNHHATFVTEKRRRITVEDIANWSEQRNAALYEDDYRVLYLLDKTKTVDKDNIVLLTARTVSEKDVGNIIPQDNTELTGNPWLRKCRKKVILVEKSTITDVRSASWRGIVRR